METVIKLDKVSKEYNGINILNNINIDIKKGAQIDLKMYIMREKKFFY